MATARGNGKSVATKRERERRSEDVSRSEVHRSGVRRSAAGRENGKTGERGVGKRRGAVELGRRRTDGRHGGRSVHNGVLRGVADDTHFRASEVSLASGSFRRTAPLAVRSRGRTIPKPIPEAIRVANAESASRIYGAWVIRRGGLASVSRRSNRASRCEPGARPKGCDVDRPLASAVVKTRE